MFDTRRSAVRRRVVNSIISFVSTTRTFYFIVFVLIALICLKLPQFVGTQSKVSGRPVPSSRKVQQRGIDLETMFDSIDHTQHRLSQVRQFNASTSSEDALSQTTYSEKFVSLDRNKVITSWNCRVETDVDKSNKKRIIVPDSSLQSCCTYVRPKPWKTVFHRTVVPSEAPIRCSLGGRVEDHVDMKRSPCYIATCGDDVNVMTKFVPNEHLKTPPLAVGSNPLNVVFIFSPAIGRCSFHATLSRFFNALGKSHKSFSHPKTVPLGKSTRPESNAPTILNGAPSGDTWYSSLFELTGHAIQTMMGFVPSEARREVRRRARSETFFPARERMLDRIFSNSLFAHFKEAGYVTQAVAGHTIAHPSSFFMNWWQQPETIDYSFFELATTRRGKRDPYGYQSTADSVVDVVEGFFRHYNKAHPKFTLLHDDIGGASLDADNAAMMIAEADRAYSRLVASLRKMGELSNTAFVMMSDFNTASVTTGVEAIAESDLLSEIWLPNSDAEDLSTDVETVLNSTSFFSPFDWHKTLRGLPILRRKKRSSSAATTSPRVLELVERYPRTMGPTPPPDATSSLFHPSSSSSSRRTCRAHGIRPHRCPTSTHQRLRFYREIPTATRVWLDNSLQSTLSNMKLLSGNVFGEYCAAAPYAMPGRFANVTVYRGDGGDDDVEYEIYAHLRSSSSASALPPPSALYRIYFHKLHPAGDILMQRVDEFKEKNERCVTKCHSEHRGGKFCFALRHETCLCTVP
eukprot:PhM_4_TR15692/c0_g1_i1/m.14263